MGAEKNDQDDQATGDTVPRVCNMFNLAKTKTKIFPLDNISGRSPPHGEKQLCKAQKSVNA